MRQICSVEKGSKRANSGGEVGGGKWIRLFFVVLFKSFILMLPFIKTPVYVAKSTTRFDAQL